MRIITTANPNWICVIVHKHALEKHINGEHQTQPKNEYNWGAEEPKCELTIKLMSTYLICFVALAIRRLDDGIFSAVSNFPVKFGLFVSKDGFGVLSLGLLKHSTSIGALDVGILFDVLDDDNYFKIAQEKWIGIPS